MSSESPSNFLPTRIVSGGQTGVDRAGLEVAIALNLEHGGWCPAGRRSEDGTVPSRYDLTETESANYRVRTRQNVIDSDATLILFQTSLKGGTLLTRRIADEIGKPVLCVRLDSERVAATRQWITEIRPQTLNVAGPRESNCRGIQELATDFLLDVFSS